LRRRPKQLAEQPLLFRPSGNGGAVASVDAAPDADARASVHHAPLPATAAGWVATDDRGELHVLEPDADVAGHGGEVRRRAQSIARRLSVRVRSSDRHERSGTGRLVSAPYRDGSDDIDLDRTLEVLAERPVPEDTEIIVRQRVRARCAVVLVVDVSGSMRGDKALTAAATVGALSAELIDDELAVIAFWKHAAVIKHLHQARAAPTILADLLQLPTRGLTNVAYALEVARLQLAVARARCRRVILLSDSVHNAGPDPRLEAARLPRLDVLLDVDGEHDGELATELALMGRGRSVPVRTYRDVAPALNRILPP
jgi:Mg-chelatase subunit ChlD